VVRFAFVGTFADDVAFRLLDVNEPSGSTFRVERALVLPESRALTIKEGGALPCAVRAPNLGSPRTWIARYSIWAHPPPQ
jgi:hypothetical protein